MTSELRAIDANVNRAMEAARVAEDLARFTLESRWLASRLKALRHAVGALPESLGLEPAAVVRARDAVGDVGRREEGPREYRRDDLAAVARANFRRLAESLRVLEECAKLRCPDRARAVEDLRYRAYRYEQAFLECPRKREALARGLLMVLVGTASCDGRPADVAAAALAGGAGAIQLREKGLADRECLALAERLRALTAGHGALLVVNDRPDIARIVGADAVHLGIEDLPLEAARAVAGEGMILGATAHTPEEAAAAEAAGADYVSAGPVRRSPTKGALAPGGPEIVRGIAGAVGVPVVAIGGIDVPDVRAVLDAGAAGLAVCAAIVRDPDPGQKTLKFRTEIAEIVGKESCP